MNDVSIPSTRYVWQIILLLTVVNVFSYMDRTALSVLMPFIKEDLQLSDAQLGLLMGFAFFLLYATCGIPIARWADRGNRRNLIALTLTVWSVMTALSGLAQNFWHLLIARMGLGVGEAGCIPAAESIISDYVPPKRRASAYAVHAFGYSAGVMAGLILAGWLGEVIGWRWTFVVLGLPGIALALLVRINLREPVRGASDGIDIDQTNRSWRETVGLLWRCRTYRLLVLFQVINAFVYSGLMQWWPSFYSRVFEIKLSSVGIGLGLAIGAGSGIGTILGGLLAIKAAHRDIARPLIFGAGSIALALVTAMAALFVPSPMISMLLAFLTLLLWCLPSGAITASLLSVVQPSMRATASALVIFCMSVLGFGLGPFCVGLLSDILTPALGAQALRYALTLPTGVMGVLVVVLYAVAKALPHDLKVNHVAAS